MTIPYNLPSNLHGAGRLSVGFNDAHARVKITACSNPHYVGKKGIYAGSDDSTHYYVVNENGVHNFTDSTPIPANTTVESRYSFAGSFHTWAAGDNPVSTKMFEYKGDLYLVFTMCINDFEGPVSSSWPQGETGPTDLTGHPHPPSMVLRMRWDGSKLTLINKVSLGINASTAVFVVDEYAGELTVVYSEAAFPTQPVKTLKVNLSNLTLSSPTTLFSVSKTLCPTDAFDARNVVYTSGVLSYDENEPIVRITNSEIEGDKVTLAFTVATPDSRKVAIIPYVAKREVLGETTAFELLPPVYPVQTSVTGMEYSYSYTVTADKESYLQHKIVAVDNLGPHSHIDTYVVGNTVTFDATRSWCLESDIVEYKWNVGSYSANTPINSYIFPNPTQQLIYLTLRDANGREQTTSSQLTLGTPVAAFSTSVNGLRVTLTPSGGTNYKWKVEGDGTWEAPNIFHFSYPQTARIILTVDDAYVTSQTITVNYVAPTAAFTTSTSYMDIALNGSGGVGYSWSFSGDINGEYVVGSSTTPTAVFRCYEEYSGTATLTVVDEYGIADSVSHPVSTNVSSPTAAFTSTAQGKKLTLNALSSTSPNGDVVGYAWSFDTTPPATYGIGSADKPVVTLLFTGNYSGNATLEVTDDKGIKDSVTQAISVTLTPVVPNISYSQANDTLILNASGSTGATNYLWELSGTPQGYWVVGGPTTVIAHYKFTANYVGNISLTTNNVTTTTPLTFSFGVPISFASRTAVAYPPLIPQIVYANFAESVAYSYPPISTAVSYADFASRSSLAFGVTLSPFVCPSDALRTAQLYTPRLNTNVLPSSILRTPLAFGPNLSFVIYPDFASSTSTAYSPLLHQTTTPTAASSTPTAYGVTFA